MNSISINEERCTMCQQCAQVCTMNIINENKGAFPIIQNEDKCFLCGHCVAVCKHDAIMHSGMKKLEISNTQPFDSGSMEYMLKIRRSCRHYRSKPVDREIVEKMIDTARYAPTAFNCQDRSFIVISDREKLKSIGRDLAQQTKKNIRIFKAVTSRPFSFFLHKDSVSHLKKAVYDFEVTLDLFEKGHDAFFHEAPCLILFTGIGIDAFGKDHALAAMYYFMDMAQSLGLGTCVIGHVQAAPKIIAKHVEVPDMHKVFGALTLGYPALTYSQGIERKPPVLCWV